MGIPIIQYWMEMMSEGATAARLALHKTGVARKARTLKDSLFNPSGGLGMVVHLLHMICLWLAIVLPVLNWDGVINWDWTLAFVPFFVLSGLVVIQGFVKAAGGNSVYLYKALDAIPPSTRKDAAGLDEDNKNSVIELKTISDKYNNISSEQPQPVGASRRRARLHLA